MASSVDDLLSIAVELSESSNEMKLRTSIGRSYYCCFHCGLNYFEIADTRSWTGGSGGVHEKLIGEFMYGGNKPVGYILQNIKAKRHIADYHLSVNMNQEDAKAVIGLANSMFEKLGK